MNADGPVIRSQMAPLFLVVFGAAGGDVGSITKRFGLPDDAASRREIELPVDTLDTIANLASAQTKDQNLGLHLASRLPRGSYGLLEYIGRSASTIRDAGERLLRYSRLLNELVTFTFEDRGATAILSQRVEGRRGCVGRHAGEMFVGLVVRYIRELTDDAWRPRAVAFAHPAPADVSEHVGYFGAPLVWERGENHVELDAAILARAVGSRDPALFSVLDAELARELASRPAKRIVDPLANIRAEIARALENGQPQLASIARSLKMSARTLQRRLGDEKTSFQELVDGVREDLARRYMADPKLALGEVAYLLGFSEISAFTRAFKRWTGTTPSRWRDRSNDSA